MHITGVKSQSIREWMRELNVILTKDPTVTEVKEATSQLTVSLTTVTENLFQTKNEVARLENELRRKKRVAMVTLREDTKEKIAKTVLDEMVLGTLEKEIKGLDQAKIQLEFWKGMKSYLYEIRKLCNIDESLLKSEAYVTR